jgi:hypothetical protein
MTVNSTSSNAGSATAADAIAKPLTELTQQQRKKVTSELARIHDLVSEVVDKMAPKHDAPNKPRQNPIDFSPSNDK